ncbi:MAG: OmpW family outer membrane protein [Opitutaceae bacterium]|jgi:outer membrane protein
MKLPTPLSAALLGLATFVTVQAASPWSVRLAPAYLQTVDSTSNNVNVATEDKFIPEFDVNYAFNSHWSVELMLTVPQEHNVKVNGTPAGDFKELPPSLFAKYSFTPVGGFTPYIGAGVNYTIIFDTELGGAKLDTYSVGPAVLVGCDYKINARWSLTAEVKKIQLRTDVTTALGAKVTEARLDPWLYSLGVCYQF